MKKIVAIKQIDSSISELYQCISFKKENKPDFERLKSFFIPNGQLINNNDFEPKFLSIDQFIDEFNDNIAKATISEFSEVEVSSKTHVFGKIAQRFSTYEACLKIGDVTKFTIGINSIQLIYIDDKWFVTSLIWNDEKENMKIPAEYFK